MSTENNLDLKLWIEFLKKAQDGTSINNGKELDFSLEEQIPFTLNVQDKSTFCCERIVVSPSISQTQPRQNLLPNR